MKMIVFILAITILACSVIPCRENTFTDNSQKSAKILKSASQQNHGDTDDCSPFCSCNCCCGITFLFTTYKVADPIAFASQEMVFQLPAKISDASLPVWQPPQLV